MQHCCFEFVLVFSKQCFTSVIQHCAFTVKHPYFKIQYSTSIIQHCALTIQHPYFKFFSHAKFVSECDMCPSQSNILVLLLHKPKAIFQIQLPFFNMRHSSISLRPWCSVCVLWCRVRYACSAMQHSCWDIEPHAWVSRPGDSKPLCNNLWTQNSLQLLSRSILNRVFKSRFPPLFFLSIPIPLLFLWQSRFFSPDHPYTAKTASRKAGFCLSTTNRSLFALNSSSQFRAS